MKLQGFIYRPFKIKSQKGNGKDEVYEQMCLRIRFYAVQSVRWRREEEVPKYTVGFNLPRVHES